MLQRRVDLWGGRRLGPTEQLQTVLVGVLDRDTMIGEDLAGEVQMLLRDHRPQRLGELIRRQLGVHALVLVRDHDVDPVGVVADVFIDPVELDLQLLRREPNCSEHTKTTSFADGDHHIAAVSEGKIGNSIPSSSQMAVCMPAPGMLADANRTETCSSLVPVLVRWPTAQVPVGFRRAPR